MNKKLFLVLAMGGLMSFPMTMQAQKRQDIYSVANIKRYEAANQEVPAKQKKEKRVVFIGNSITEGWYNAHPDWFKANNYFGRGIGGQTSPQMLLRFHADVVALQPDVVVINAGTNDIAENTGTYHPSFTLSNIKAMAEIALANNIKVILTSVLPHDGFKWNPSIQDVVQKVDELNAQIKAYAAEKKIPYVDYNSEMRNEKGGMKKELSNDGVHPYADTYLMMEALVKPVIDKQLKKK